MTLLKTSLESQMVLDMTTHYLHFCLYVASHIHNRMLTLVKENNLIKGIQYPYAGLEVVNIQYADDTLLFLSPTEDCH